MSQTSKQAALTLVKSVPAATAAVSRQQCSRSPFTSRTKQRAVCAASSLEGASTTAPGPFGTALGPSAAVLGLLGSAVCTFFCSLFVFLSGLSEEELSVAAVLGSERRC